MSISWLDQQKWEYIYSILKKTGFNTLTPQQPQLYILKYWRQSLGFYFTSLPTASKQMTDSCL